MRLTVGVPKEIKTGEGRVGLTPKGVESLAEQAVTVYVEKGAGFKTGFSNQDYQRAGALLARDRKELWKKSDIIKKVKQPGPEEFELFEPRHIIFSYLHLASPAERPLVEALQKSRATAIAYETVEENGQTPLLAPMSELAGILSAYFAGVFQNYIQIRKNEIYGLPLARGIMEQAAFNYPYVPKNVPLGQVIILGGGRVGINAAIMSKRMGATVFLSEVSEPRRRLLAKEFKSHHLSIHVLDPQETMMYEAFLISSSVIISAVHTAGERAPLVIDAVLLQKISKQKKKIILDIAIDQGGNVAESRPTDYEQPLYLDSFGNLRFSVTNIPSLASSAASSALEAASIKYTSALADGLAQAIAHFPELKAGINILKGKLIYEAVARAHNMPLEEPSKCLLDA